MNSIFIIRAISNNYDIDNWSVGWVETQEQAVEKVKLMNEVHELAMKYNERIWDFRNHLYDTLPKEELETVPSYPKWPAGLAEKDITQEMKDLRSTIKKTQSEVNDRNYIKNKRRSEEIGRLTQEFITTLNLNSEVSKELNEEVEHIRSYDWYELEKL